MSVAEEVVVKFPVKTKLVCSDCGAPGEGSCRCGAPYVSPGERAEAAVKANPKKSDRMISEETGIPQRTVSRARNRTEPNGSVEKRTGKDGKARKQPKPSKPRGESADKYQKARTEVRGSLSAGQPVVTKKVAQKLDVSVDTVERAALAEQARFDALKELNIDPETLVPSAKAKLEIAKRQVERKLDAEHVARLRAVDEEVRLRVIAENADYVAMVKELEVKARSDQALWREMIDGRKSPFTIDQFKTILMCLHPDGERTPDKLTEAFRLFNNKKLQLTGVKQ